MGTQFDVAVGSLKFSDIVLIAVAREKFTMKKIPTIFIRDMTRQPAMVTPEWKHGCEWVRDGEGVATLKHDGTCCLVRAGRLFKRREIKQGLAVPADFELAQFDEETGKAVGWVPVIADNPDDRYHLEAFALGGIADGTYELMGPKIQGNKGGFSTYVLVPHGREPIADVPRSFEGLRAWLETNLIEGVVWHHIDGRAAKIKRRDFGFRW
jgi:hypothetical protein